jgi:hypothetical protein
LFLVLGFLCLIQDDAMVVRSYIKSSMPSPCSGGAPSAVKGCKSSCVSDRSPRIRLIFICLLVCFRLGYSIYRSHNWCWLLLWSFGSLAQQIYVFQLQQALPSFNEGGVRTTARLWLAQCLESSLGGLRNFL